MAKKKKKYVRAYYNDTISNKENGYQVDIMFFEDKDTEDYFDEEFTTTKSPLAAVRMANKINREGLSIKQGYRERFYPKK